MRRALPTVGLVLLVLAIAGGQWLRTSLDIEWSAVAIQERVASFGWRAPAVYLGLVIFRQFMAIPAILLLTAGGLCFGAVLGGTLGALGILVSGVMKFSIARAIGRDALRRWHGDFHGRVERRLGRLGPLAVAVVTAHPVGPMAPLHWAAGLAPISLGAFVAALTIGAPVRAFAYAFLGQTLTDVGSAGFWIATLLLSATVAVPLLMPSVRSHIRQASLERVRAPVADR